MYGYRTNHKILGAYITWKNKSKEDLIEINNLCNLLPKAKYKRVIRSIVSLELDGCFNYKHKEKKTLMIYS